MHIIFCALKYKRYPMDIIWSPFTNMKWWWNVYPTDLRWMSHYCTWKYKWYPIDIRFVYNKWDKSGYPKDLIWISHLWPRCTNDILLRSILQKLIRAKRAAADIYAMNNLIILYFYWYNMNDILFQLTRWPDLKLKGDMSYTQDSHNQDRYSIWSVRISWEVHKDWY